MYFRCLLNVSLSCVAVLRRWIKKLIIVNEKTNSSAIALFYVNDTYTHTRTRYERSRRTKRSIVERPLDRSILTRCSCDVHISPPPPPPPHFISPSLIFVLVVSLSTVSVASNISLCYPHYGKWATKRFVIFFFFFLFFAQALRDPPLMRK